ncbi:MAG TPA: hypothetical protein VHZ95_05115, partial [Polyangiales bacterium]|nr:hypothetical protein [Polyangiales bacterium]
ELSEATELATELLQAKLLQRRRRDELACFHDRIRHVAVARLSRERTREIHAGLARALARWPDADPAAIASHCDAAGLIDEAVVAYARAGQHALTALAFARADQLFARALELAADGGKASVLVPLEMARGHALARAGKSAEAAAQYSSAARRVEGEDRTRLRIWAAQHLLQSARVAEGMDAVRALLSELDLPLPASAAATLASLMWDRACLRLSGLQMLPALRAIGVQERMQLDALWGLAMPVSWLEPLTSALLSTRHLRLARKFGEPAHMARALAEEAFTRTIQQPNDPEADVLLARARSLFRDREDPALEVRLSFREATVATFRWDLPRARERLEHAQRIGTERCPDQPWLVTNVRTNLASLLTTMGDHAQHVSETSAWLDEARDRNDQFALTVIEAVGIGILRHLVADDPDRARLQLTAALAPWPAQPFSFVHLGELISLSYSELYRGGIGARTWFDREASRLSRAFLLKTGLGKAALLMFRACSFLAARAVTPAQAPQLTAAAASCAEKLRAIPLTLAHINATCIEAQVAAVSGDRAAALDKARACRIESERSSYGFMAHTVEYLEGVLEESAGAERRRAALDFFGAQGWKRPERAVAIMCPAVDSPEVRS